MTGRPHPPPARDDAAALALRIDRALARVLLERPERACAYARDGWIDIDEADVAAHAGRPAGR